MLIGCIVTDDDKYGNCYERLMHDAIEKKYGEDFISKSKKIVDSIYHRKNPDTIYLIVEVNELIQAAIDPNNLALI